MCRLMSPSSRLKKRGDFQLKPAISFPLPSPFESQHFPPLLGYQPGFLWNVGNWNLLAEYEWKEVAREEKVYISMYISTKWYATSAVYRSKKFVREFTLIVIYTYKAVTFLRRMEENTPPFIIRSWEREILLLLSSVIAITLWHSSYEGPRLKARLIINGQIYLTVKRADSRRASLRLNFPVSLNRFVKRETLAFLLQTDSFSRFDGAP